MKTCTLLPAGPNMQDLPTFYKENLARIYQFVSVQVKNREVAEDLTSQIFLRAVQHPNYQLGSQSPGNWLLQIAHTTVMDYWRSIERAPTALPDLHLEIAWEMLNQDSTPGTNNNQAERVEHILQRLPEQYRKVLIYRILLKYTVSEVAQIMGMTEASVKTLQFRALNGAAVLESTLPEND